MFVFNEFDFCSISYISKIFYFKNNLDDFLMLMIYY